MVVGWLGRLICDVGKRSVGGRRSQGTSASARPYNGSEGGQDARDRVVQLEDREGR